MGMAALPTRPSFAGLAGMATAPPPPIYPRVQHSASCTGSGMPMHEEWLMAQSVASAGHSCPPQEWLGVDLGPG